MKKLSQTVLYLCLVLVLSACSFSLAEDITPPPNLQQQQPSQAQPAAVSSNTFPLLPPNPANGEAIYAEKCSPCHGDAGLGDGPQAAQLPNPPAALGSPDLARQVHFGCLVPNSYPGQYSELHAAFHQPDGWSALGCRGLCIYPERPSMDVGPGKSNSFKQVALAVMAMLDRGMVRTRPV